MRVARTEEERLRAYRVRYDVLCVECGDHRYADHTARVYVDANDEKQTVLLIACDETDQVIGTARVTVRRDCGFLREHLYSFEHLAALVHCPTSALLDRVALLDRGAVLPAWRGKAVGAELTRLMERVAEDAGCQIGLSVTHAANRASQNSLRRLGWTQYETREADGWIGILWYKQLVDSNSCP